MRSRARKLHNLDPAAAIGRDGFVIVRRAALVATVLLGLASCDRPAPPRARVPDKAALYGDAGLIPTREGEAARRELAMSAELAKVIGASGWTSDVHVDVEIGDATTSVIVGGLRNRSAPEDVEQRIAAAARAIAGDSASVTLVLGEAVTSDPPRAIDVPLLLAVLGLGASASLMIDRAWRRRRRITPRVGSRAPR